MENCSKGKNFPVYENTGCLVTRFSEILMSFKSFFLPYFLRFKAKTFLKKKKKKNNVRRNHVKTQ